jgi:hypothetical protein
MLPRGKEGNELKRPHSTGRPCIRVEDAFGNRSDIDDLGMLMAARLKPCRPLKDVHSSRSIAVQDLDLTGP